MKRFFAIVATALTITLALSIVHVHAQSNSSNEPTLQTIQCLGGSGDEGNFSNFMTPTNDGGFVTCSYSTSNDGNVSNNHGGSDVWVVKFNAMGNVQWKKTYGGSSDDYANRIIQTSDGGYIFLGYTYSNDGDVSGNHGEGDLWVVKLSASGNIGWQRCYGGSGDEFAYYGIIATADGGYAFIGSSASNNGDANGNHGGYDVLVVKINASGNVIWSKTYGGSNDEYGNLIVQNSDGTYTVSADTYSTNGNISGNHGASDTWVARLNANGTINWKKCLGGSDEEFNASLIATNDGNILVGDYAGSHDGDVTGNHGVVTNGGDMWLVKLNRANGNIVWTKTLGGSNGGYRPSLPDYPDDEVALFINETTNGDLLVAGGSTSSDGDCTVNRGVGDCWILRLDNHGNIIWQKSFGGSDEDAATAIFPSSIGGYVVAGWTYSNDFDFNNRGQHGNGDLFIARFSPSSNHNRLAVDDSDATKPSLDVTRTSPNSYSVSFSLAAPQQLSVEVMDAAGRRLGTLASAGFTEGSYTINWDVSALASGIYFLKMESNGVAQTEKISVIK